MAGLKNEFRDWWRNTFEEQTATELSLKVSATYSATLLAAILSGSEPPISRATILKE